eukprot:365595-Chlamydomonas_euryale.AAC.17
MTYGNKGEACSASLMLVSGCSAPVESAARFRGVTRSFDPLHQIYPIHRIPRRFDQQDSFTLLYPIHPIHQLADPPTCLFDFLHHHIL